MSLWQKHRCDLSKACIIGMLKSLRRRKRNRSIAIYAPLRSGALKMRSPCVTILFLNYGNTAKKFYRDFIIIIPHPGIWWHFASVIFQYPKSFANATPRQSWSKAYFADLILPARRWEIRTCFFQWSSERSLPPTALAHFRSKLWSIFVHANL